MDDIIYSFEYMVLKEILLVRLSLEKDDEGVYYSPETCKLFMIYRAGFLDGQKG